MNTSISIEIGSFERAHSRFTTVGNGDLETLARQTNLDGNAHHRVVIDHENARHDDSFFLGAAASRTSHVTIKSKSRQVVCMVECP
jgi:hypothetical protein